MITNVDSEQNHLNVDRFFTADLKKHPFEEIEWVKRDSVIYDENGQIVFEQKDVTVPKSWSQLATDIAASKYFRRSGLGENSDKPEDSVEQIITRVARTLSGEGRRRGYFKTKKESLIFEEELSYILVNQMAAFNSPVWFNCGLYHEYNIKADSNNYYWNPDTDKIEITDNAYRHPQNSACFIQSVDDSLDSMLELQQSEVNIFKYGSGTGTNFSKIRGKNEKLTSGGTSSGIISFLEGFDRWAGCIRSGGTTRRAAKMVLLDLDHPEIIDYIEWKSKEEQKALSLIKDGYPSSFTGEAYHTVSGQNSNNSVRIPDEFMESYLRNGTWQTKYRTNGEVADTYDAKFLMNKIAKEAHACADPGVQFDDTIQKWHTCKYTDKINASNPCSEYLFLDDSACNLASLNLVKFLDEDNTFSVDRFRAAVQILIVAMEIIVDVSSYPTEKIARNSHDYRPLGLGFTNLGSLFMMLGYPYDSPEARSLAASISAIMSAEAYIMSSMMASCFGPFNGYHYGTPKQNKESMLEVMRMHRDAAFKIDKNPSSTELYESACKSWALCVKLGEQWGYRNSQISVIAPTGTIALLMDSDTTGIEPEFSLVKLKKLADGGYMRIVNNSVYCSLKNLGYTTDETQSIIDYLIGTGTLNNTPHINTESLKQKGLLPEEIKRIEQILPGSFNLSMAFVLGFLNPGAFDRLGIDINKGNLPNFDLLTELGFTEKQIQEAETVICGTGTLEGAPHLKREHYKIFDCAIPSNEKRDNYIRYMGSLELMAAVQPFISGAISKTVNIPEEATVMDIENLYLAAWELGIKCLAIYRDGSKGSQPLSNQTSTEESNEEDVQVPARRRLPDTRNAIAHKFSVDSVEGYLHIGLFEDGQPGELFIRIAKNGSTLSGLLDTVGTLVSIALQYGVPISTLVNKFKNVSYEPSGFTINEDIPIASSITDYVFQFLEKEFL